jgi:hypothetical protein
LIISQLIIIAVPFITIVHNLIKCLKYNLRNQADQLSPKIIQARTSYRKNNYLPQSRESFSTQYKQMATSNKKSPRVNAFPKIEKVIERVSTFASL